MKLTQSQDGVLRSTIKVEYRLTKEELVLALALDTEVFETLDELPETMGRNEVLKRIRNSLRYYGEDDIWGREIPEEYRSWAEKQIERLAK